MYTKVIDDLKNKEQKIKEQIQELQGQLNPYQDALKSMQELQTKHLHEKYKAEGILATQTGVCPFPDECVKRDIYTERSCKYDELDNGHPRKR